MSCGTRHGSLLRRNGNLRDCKHRAQNHHTKDRKTSCNGTAHGDLFLKRTMKRTSSIIVDSLHTCVGSRHPALMGGRQTTSRLIPTPRGAAYSRTDYGAEGRSPSPTFPASHW